eukprot:jgi/Psemu1/24006/gm1.24006_g
MYHKLPSGCTPKTLLPSPIGTPPVDTSSPKKGKASLIWLSLGSMNFNLEEDEEDEKQANEMLQKPFYSKVLKWSNNYDNQANTGKGHYVRRIKLSELVHFDGIIYLHDALEGKKASICYRWTKSNLKLNCNFEAKYNRLSCKDDKSKFNYACKFDYIYETFIHNAHYISKKDIFMKYVIQEIGKLWSSPHHLTADNFFNGDSILDWMGGLGFGMIGTAAQNMLPKTVEDKCFHKENVSSASGKRSLHVARICNPITMIKEVPACAAAGRFTKGAISRSNIGYKSWKYYHAPIIDAKALAVLTAFDMYQEPIDDKAYPVDTLLRDVTQSSTKQRLAQSDRRRSCAYFFGGKILNYHCLETVFEAWSLI